jgi:hypothetical protein
MHLSLVYLVDVRKAGRRALWYGKWWTGGHVLSGQGRPLHAQYAPVEPKSDPNNPHGACRFSDDRNDAPQSSCSLNYGGVSSPYTICSSHQHYQVITVDIHTHVFGCRILQPVRDNQDQGFHMNINIYTSSNNTSERKNIALHEYTIYRAYNPHPIFVHLKNDHKGSHIHRLIIGGEVGVSNNEIVKNVSGLHHTWYFIGCASTRTCVGSDPVASETKKYRFQYNCYTEEDHIGCVIA